MPKAIISPSILSADFAILKEEAKRMQEAGADTLHVDVMDGHFVPNITIGPCIVQSLRKHTSMFLDCHLMVQDPLTWGREFVKAGADGITFHLECNQTAQVIQELKGKTKLGLAIKPNTPVENVIPFIQDIQMVLVMTVEPGFGGQKMIHDCLKKVNYLRDRYPDLEIQVDGGIDSSNIEVVAQHGANNIVSGTGIFKSNDPKSVISVMSKTVNQVYQ